jgi:hypothetical protein
MLFTSESVNALLFERATGWSIKPEGACKGDVCVPLPAQVRQADGSLSARALAERLGMAVVRGTAGDVFALGPDTAVTGRALTTAFAPDLELPTLDGEPFRLSSLRGTKVAIISWASW